MMVRGVVLGIAVLLLGFSATSRAQLRPRGDAVLPRPGAARQLPDETTNANRAQLERRFRQMLFQMTRRRVGLSPEQMNRLVPINQRFETQRRAIQRQERETRLALRDAMRDSTQVDQSRITSYLDKLVELQHQRVDLVGQEQKELATFMTPLQRARYMALQEQVRRRIEQMLRQRRRAAADSSLPNVPEPQ